MLATETMTPPKSQWLNRLVFLTFTSLLQDAIFYEPPTPLPVFESLGAIWWCCFGRLQLLWGEGRGWEGWVPGCWPLGIIYILALVLAWTLCFLVHQDVNKCSANYHHHHYHHWLLVQPLHLPLLWWTGPSKLWDKLNSSPKLLLPRTLSWW